MIATSPNPQVQRQVSKAHAWYGDAAEEDIAVVPKQVSPYVIRKQALERLQALTTHYFSNWVAILCSGHTKAVTAQIK